MPTDVVHSPFKGMDMPPWWDFHCSIAAGMVRCYSWCHQTPIWYKTQWSRCLLAVMHLFALINMSQLLKQLFLLRHSGQCTTH